MPAMKSWRILNPSVQGELGFQVSDLRTLVSRYIPNFERWFSKLLIFIWIFPPLNFWVLSRFIQSFFQHMPSSDEKNMSWASSKYILCSQWPCTRWTHVTLSGMSYLGHPTMHMYDAHALHFTALHRRVIMSQSGLVFKTSNKLKTKNLRSIMVEHRSWSLTWADAREIYLLRKTDN